MCGVVQVVLFCLFLCVGSRSTRSPVTRKYHLQAKQTWKIPVIMQDFGGSSNDVLTMCSVKEARRSTAVLPFLLNSINQLAKPPF